MAALYLHNAIFVQESPGGFPRHPHTRSASSGTLRTVTSDSHPTEPLLNNLTTEALAFKDMLSRQPTHPDDRSPRWDTQLNLASERATLQERKTQWEKLVRRRLRRLRWVKRAVEAAIAAWTTYNIVRYFISFTMYSSFDGQVASIALGISATLSLAVLIASSVMSLMKSFLTFHNLPLPFQFTIRTALHFFSSILLLIPAIVNLVIVFLWRNNSDRELSLNERCRVDIDAIWSFSRAACQPPSWVTWLALAILRIALTLAVIVLHLGISLAYQRTRRPSQLPRPLVLGSKLSAPYYYEPSFSTPASGPSSGALTSGGLTPKSSDFHLQQASGSTLVSSPSRYHDRSVRSSHTSGPSLHREPSTKSQLGRHAGRASGSSPNSSSDEVCSEYEKPPNLTVPGIGIASLAQTYEADGAFVDRFHAILSQVQRETEEGLLNATGPVSPIDPETTAHAAAGGPPPRLDIPDNYAKEQNALYDRFNYEYARDEEHVYVMGAYVTRMPTIASLSSGEVSSPTGTSDATGLGSRPPTRTNRMSVATTDSASTSMTGSLSAPPSRANSMQLPPSGPPFPNSVPGSRSGSSGSGSATGSTSTGTGTTSSSSRVSYLPAVAEFINRRHGHTVVSELGEVVAPNPNLADASRVDSGTSVATGNTVDTRQSLNSAISFYTATGSTSPLSPSPTN